MASKGVSKALQELRIHFCQNSPASSGTREFVVKKYAELKKVNPLFPILVREAEGAEAKLIARFEYGVEKAVSVQGDSAAAVEQKLHALIK